MRATVPICARWPHHAWPHARAQPSATRQMFLTLRCIKKCCGSVLVLGTVFGVQNGRQRSETQCLDGGAVPKIGDLPLLRSLRICCQPPWLISHTRAALDSRRAVISAQKLVTFLGPFSGLFLVPSFWDRYMNLNRRVPKLGTKKGPQNGDQFFVVLGGQIISWRRSCSRPLPSSTKPMATRRRA